MASLSRELARWVAGLRYDDLPPAVIDRAKGVTLHGLSSVLLGSQTPAGRQAVKLITEEEAGARNGATVMVTGAKATKGGAAFANSEMAMAGAKLDSFRMLTIAHVDVTAALCAEHGIPHEDIDGIEAVVNWLETQYPSPAFPIRREDILQTQGGTAYFAAYGAVTGGYPVLRGSGFKPGPGDDPPEVLDLMKRVTIIPSHQMTLFGPRITIHTRDGKSYTKQATGREFMWDFEEEARRIREVIPGLPIPAAQFESIIATCRELDRHGRADALVQLTLAK